jgi:hypothetical protein
MKTLLRYRWMLLSVATMLVGMLACLIGPESQFSRRQYNRIHLGMPLSEVEKILGCPPGWYGWDPRDEPDLIMEGDPVGQQYSWYGEVGSIGVLVNEAGVITCKKYETLSERESPPMWRKLKTWISRLEASIGLLSIVADEHGFERIEKWVCDGWAKPCVDKKRQTVEQAAGCFVRSRRTQSAVSF